jgi:hypothetical protein
MFFQSSQPFLFVLVPLTAMLIPIVAHFMGKAHSERQRHETIRELVRAGQPIPPELLLDVQDSDWHRARRNEANPNRILIPAVITGSVGLGLMGMFAVMSPGSWLWSIGLLPLFFGLGLAVYWNVERQQTRQQP